MKLSTWIKFIVVLIVALLGQQIYVNRSKILKKHHAKQEDLTAKTLAESKLEVEDLEQEEEEEPRNLEELVARPELLIREINRMAHSFDRELFDFLVPRFKQLNVRAQGSFIDQIARHDQPPVTKFLKQLIEGAGEKELRLRAISALAKAKSKQRESLLKKLYQQHRTKDELEQIIILGSYYRILTDNAEVGKITLDMFRLVKSARDDKNADLLFRGLLELSKVDPENQNLLKLTGDILLAQEFNEHDELNNYLVRVQARYRPKVLGQDFFKYFNHPSMRVKVEMINSLSMICPKNIWEILTKIVQDYPETRLHLPVARQLVFFNREKAEKFFQEHRDEIKIEEDKWRKIRMKILESELSDTCEEVEFVRPEGN